MISILLDKALIDPDRYGFSGRSLFIGKTGELMDSVAPYLCPTDLDEDDFMKFLSDASSINWGILIHSEYTFKELHHHLRKFLYVKTEQGKKLYFRYYDPSVLPTFLRTCDQEQLDEFFGSVTAFLCKTDLPREYIIFKRDHNGQLIESPLTEEELFESNNNS